MDYSALSDEELFYKVAERMGYEDIRRETRFARWTGEPHVSFSGVVKGERVTIDNPVTSIAAAWKLVEELQAPPHEQFFGIQHTPAILHNGKHCWHVELGGVFAHGETAPRAICTAWLQWQDKEE